MKFWLAVPGNSAWIVWGWVNRTGYRVVLGEYRWFVVAAFRRWWLDDGCFHMITLERVMWPDRAGGMP